MKITNIFFFFQAEDGIRDKLVTGVQTCALPISFEQKEIDCSLGEYQSQLFMLAAGLLGRWRQVRPEAVFERRENSGDGGGAFAACFRARLAGESHAGPQQARGKVLEAGRADVTHVFAVAE